ncbi:membrane protein [Pseudomonas sp. S9]|uniref:membrane protein n=1 Tax=Pseudomonas sp. S9 TaxID=686578 RepID=UPI0002557043|nr:membrane protein [Pseudomonas sp. S9]
MQYDGLAWVTALLAVLTVLVAARILFGGNWLLGWLRGTCGLFFLGLAALVGLVAYDLYSYSPLPESGPLATLSFKADGDRYQVQVTEGEATHNVIIQGDLWQLDARLLRWKGIAELIGLKPGYRLQKLTGRFLAIEQQSMSVHAQAELAQSPYGIDLWRWLRLGKHDLMMFDPQALRVTYLPIADNAQYRVSLTPTGLLAEPMNSAAKQALKDWK